MVVDSAAAWTAGVTGSWTVWPATVAATVGSGAGVGAVLAVWFAVWAGALGEAVWGLWVER